MKDFSLLNSRRLMSRLTASLAVCIFCTASNAQDVPPAPEAADAAASPADIPPLPPVVREAMKPEALPENAVTQPRQGQKTLFDDNWVVEIRPAAAKPAPVASANFGTIDIANYETIYNSIPYRRSEYLANPSYRHDTTVEILFGEMRDTVVHRHDHAQRVVNPRPGLYDPGFFREFEYWRYPGNFIQIIPGFGPIVAPRF